MTQTVSFKDKLRHAFTVFKWELRNCTGSLIVFAILAGVATTIILTLALTVGISDALNDDGSMDLETVQEAVRIFQMIASYAVFYINAVFTIIYTIKIYSYLHDKRKADMYGALPISRRTFFVAKTISAYLLSIVPTYFFLGIIAVISVAFGQPLVTEVTALYLNLLIGAIACISFYALLAVCCGTTPNTVLSFIAVNLAYPIAALFIKGTIKAFFIGLPASRYNESFIMKALNPLAAYIGGNVVYWILFTAACLALGIWLVKKRRAECAQTSFAYYLPVYIVKLLVSFIIGMFLGVLFASLNVFGMPFLAFIFGFSLGSMPAYVIAHLIFYKEIRSIPQTLIAFGGMCVAVVALMGVCHFDVTGYSRYVPKTEEIASAGFIDLEECYQAGSESVYTLADMAANDFDKPEQVDKITAYHRSVIEVYYQKDANRYANIWSNMLLSNLPLDWSNDGTIVSYQLKSGRKIMRYYDPRFTIFSDYTNSAADSLEPTELLDSEVYFANYSAFMQAPSGNVTDMTLLIKDKTGKPVRIAENVLVGDAQAAADRETLLNAIRADVNARPETERAVSSGTVTIAYTRQKPHSDNSLFNAVFSTLSYYNDTTDSCSVYPDDKHFNEALVQIGILNSDGTYNENNRYTK